MISRRARWKKNCRYCLKVFIKTSIYSEAEFCCAHCRKKHIKENADTKSYDNTAVMMVGDTECQVL